MDYIFLALVGQRLQQDIINAHLQRMWPGRIDTRPVSMAANPFEWNHSSLRLPSITFLHSTPTLGTLVEDRSDPDALEYYGPEYLDGFAPAWCRWPPAADTFGWDYASPLFSILHGLEGETVHHKYGRKLHANLLASRQMMNCLERYGGTTAPRKFVHFFHFFVSACRSGRLFSCPTFAILLRLAGQAVRISSLRHSAYLSSNAWELAICRGGRRGGKEDEEKKRKKKTKKTLARKVQRHCPHVRQDQKTKEKENKTVSLGGYSH